MRHHTTSLIGENLGSSWGRIVQLIGQYTLIVLATALAFLAATAIYAYFWPANPDAPGSPELRRPAEEIRPPPLRIPNPNSLRDAVASVESLGRMNVPLSREQIEQISGALLLDHDNRPFGKVTGAGSTQGTLSVLIGSPAEGIKYTDVPVSAVRWYGVQNRVSFGILDDAWKPPR